MQTLKIIITSIIFFSPTLSLAQSLGLVKSNVQSANGDCLPGATASINTIIKRNKVRPYTGDTSRSGSRNLRTLASTSDDRLQSLAMVLGTIEQIGRTDFSAQKNVKIVFGRKAQSSRRLSDHIQLNPGNQNTRPMRSTKYGGTDNMGLIAHELGHEVGNNQNFYSRYFKAVGPCNITRYAKSRSRGRREEFAEVFAAYITNPSLFQNRGRNCTKAFEFFKTAFNERDLRMSCSSRRSSGN